MKVVSNNNAVLDIRNLWVDFPDSVPRTKPVRGIDLTIMPGEMLCLVGESGCGKSLTSYAAMGILPPGAVRTADRVGIAGTDLMTLSARDQTNLRGNRIAMIFQEPMTALNPAYTIGSQMCEGYVQHRRGSRSEARRRAKTLLERVGMADADRRLDQYPHQLSGGLRQRVVIAMSLMCEPDIIIADEPTTALDVTVQLQILRLLKDLQAETGVGILLVTHDLGVVANFGHRVAVMYAGQIVETGLVRDVLANPRHPYSRALLGCLPRAGASRLATIEGTVPPASAEIGGCTFSDRCSFSSHECTVEVERLARNFLETGCRCIRTGEAEVAGVR